MPELVANELAHPDGVDADLVVAVVVARRVGDDLEQIARGVVDVEDLGRVSAGAEVLDVRRPRTLDCAEPFTVRLAVCSGNVVGIPALR